MTLGDRFAEKYTVEPFSACWLWTGAMRNDAYGALLVNRKWISAHRIAWELYRGAIPIGLHVCHSCDTPLCVNPAHLFVGTNSDNQVDKAKKGRAMRLKGEQHGRSKLTSEQVQAVRSSKENDAALGRFYGVRKGTIRKIRIGENWRHILRG